VSVQREVSSIECDGQSSSMAVPRRSANILPFQNGCAHERFLNIGHVGRRPSLAATWRLKVPCASEPCCSLSLLPLPLLHTQPAAAGCLPSPPRIDAAPTHKNECAAMCGFGLRRGHARSRGGARGASALPQRGRGFTSKKMVRVGDTLYAKTGNGWCMCLL